MIELKIIKDKLEKLREEFHKFYNPGSEYGHGYLDCLVEVAKELNIPAKRLEYDIAFKDCSTCSKLEIESMTGVCSEKGIIENIPVSCTSWKEEDNQLSKDLHSGEFCNTEKCELLNDKQKEKNQIKFEIYQELLTILNSTSEIYKDDSLDIKLQAGLHEAIFRLVKEPIIGDEDYE